ncbi:MAG: hypothetical protein ACT4TC_12895 [Myxococcaceae bacterium]
MRKNNNKGGVKVRSMGAKAKQATLTLGDLIVAAYDTVGTEVREVARVLTSRDMTHRLHCRIVCDA